MLVKPILKKKLIKWKYGIKCWSIISGVHQIHITSWSIMITMTEKLFFTLEICRGNHRATLLSVSTFHLRTANLLVHWNPPKVHQSSHSRLQPNKLYKYKHKCKYTCRLFIKPVPCVFCKVLNNRLFFSSLSIPKFDVFQMKSALTK